MAKNPSFQFYPSDDLLLDATCRRMSLEALGAHMKLYCLAWIEHGLPANPAELSRELKISLRKFNSLWKEISPAWEELDGRIYCKTQEGKRQERDDFVAKQRTNGRKGGRPRVTQPEPTTETQEEPKETQALFLANPNKSSSSSSSLTTTTPPVGPPTGAAKPKRSGKAKSATATALPPDWEPIASHREKALVNRLDLDVERESFRNHHLAKGSRFVDWNAAFHTWLGKALEFGRGGKVRDAGWDDVQRFLDDEEIV